MEMAASGITKKPSKSKPLCQFYEIFDVKQKTSVWKLGAAKTNQKATGKGTYLWYDIQKRKGIKKPAQV